MSAGVIWYKMQPQSGIARAISDLLSDYCGELQSHNATVQPQKLRTLLADVLEHTDAAVIVGGTDVLSPEENAVFVTAGALSVPLEEGRRSRSRYCFDTLRGTKLPSPAGSVLFPTRFGGPEGMLLIAGRQTVVLLPGDSRAAVAAAVAMRRFLAPYAAKRRKSQTAAAVAEKLPKSYQKFAYSSRIPSVMTREYSEGQLSAVMQRAAAGARRRYRSSPLDGNRFRGAGQPLDSQEDEAFYRRQSLQDRIRNILSLLLVLGCIAAAVIVFVFLPETV